METIKSFIKYLKMSRKYKVAIRNVIDVFYDKYVAKTNSELIKQKLSNKM